MKKFSLIFLAAFLFLTLSACTAQKNVSNPIVPATTNQTATTAPVTTTAASTGGGYSLSDVATHQTDFDCWAVIEGSVYDLSAYIQSAQHPGGDKISQCCGIDCSKVFKAIGKHSSAVTGNVLQQYYLGALIK